MEHFEGSSIRSGIRGLAVTMLAIATRKDIWCENHILVLSVFLALLFLFAFDQEQTKDMKVVLG